MLRSPTIFASVSLTLLCLALTARPAHAQIVNVQAQVSDVAEGFSGSLEGSLDWKTGNTHLLLGSGGGRLAYRSQRNLFFGIVKGAYGKIFHVEPNAVVEARTFSHVRYRRELWPCILGEAFVQHEADRFRRLNTRALAGFGPRFVLAEYDKVDAFWGVAYMFEYERLDQDEAADAGQTQRNHRASSYLVGHYNPNKAVRLSQSAYFQPKLTGPSDFRMLSETTLGTKLGSHLEFKTTFVLNYDTAPPATIAKLDTALETSIEYSF